VDPIVVPVQIEPERIMNAMISAIEHNHMTRAWCAGVYLVNSKRYADLDSLWYADTKLYDGRDFTIEIHEVPDEGEPEKTVKHRCHRKDLPIFLARMARKAPRHFADMVGEDGGDAITADVFLQFVAGFDEIRYG